MTFSLLKPTAMTETQAANNKSSTLNVKGDAAADIAGDGESSSAESSFSKLFSLFNHDNQTPLDSNTVKTDKTAALGASDNIDDGIDDGIDKEVDAGLTGNTNDVAAIAGDELSTMSRADSSLKGESSDDFLARLGQSSMLLQGNAVSEAGQSSVGDPLAEAKNSGNELPLAEEGANIATASSTGITELPTLESSSTEATDSIDALTASTLAGTSTVASLTYNNPRTAKNDSLSTGDVMNGAGFSDSSSDGSGASELLDSTGKPGLTTSLGEAGLAKNTPFGQTNAMAAGISSAAVESNNSALEQLNGTAAEPIEQLDFAQIMESARKPELLEQTTRTLAKPPILTDAEQQVLEKRVNLNNNLASSELNEKIAIMAGKELQTATIRLDPAELGSMNIKLVVQNDQINVTIQAQNNQSRDLLEQQMPRLREMLQQQGITLGDTQVQADSGQQQSGFQQSGQENGQKNSNNETNYAIESQSEAPVTTQHWQDSAKGVDFYA